MGNPLNSNNPKPALAIFASGNGTNFQSILEANLPVDIKLLVCDHSDAYVIKRAKEFNVPAFIIPSKAGKTKAEREEKILKKLKELNIDGIVLAGFMKILGNTLINAYPKKIINLHPALLPHFKGRHGIEDAYNAGVSETGVTIHFIDQGIDTGQIITQSKVPRYQNDSIDQLADRIHQEEHRIYPETILKLTKEGVF